VLGRAQISVGEQIHTIGAEFVSKETIFLQWAIILLKGSSFTAVWNDFPCIGGPNSYCGQKCNLWAVYLEKRMI
jgi:hypothetical protein